MNSFLSVLLLAALVGVSFGRGHWGHHGGRSREHHHGRHSSESHEVKPGGCHGQNCATPSPIAPPTIAPVTAGPVSPSGKCGLPNAMPPGKVVVDWQKKDGLLYEYDVLDTPGLPTDPQEVNTMAKETLLGYVCLPGSLTPVANVIREYSFVEVAQDNTTECVGHFVQSFASNAGQQNMTVFDSSVATTSRQLVYYQIYDEPSVLGIRYSCKQPNLQTGICEVPKVIVDIRKRPDQLTAQEKAACDFKINQVLSQYCISTSTPNFEKSIFRADLFPCNPDPSAAFNALLANIKANNPAPQGNPPRCAAAASAIAG